VRAVEIGLSQEELRGGVVVVKVVGEVDVYTFAQLRDCLVELLERETPPRHVGLDLSEVDFFDSTALGVAVGFLKRYRRVDAGAVIALVAPSERVAKIFRITGLTNVFPSVDSAEALLKLTEEKAADGLAGEGDAEEKCA
jgi:anti-sigma B factor antagonist